MASGSPISSPQHLAEEGSRKRELRLLKNREAARECRRKKKEYVKCLENRVAVLENQNKTLIEELKALKELYCQKDA
ncbi:cAMP-responsive element modulator [Elysia marginata]|uniref:cAMP-responsive element modulator n=1 Tax=Elysia marginata TaxID=1093978 RepID=A0AAV4EQC1_9GAST|nr:cAMP-responsive element modulator [Elysia marginata]